jgi:O-methyltransferase
MTNDISRRYPPDYASPSLAVWGHNIDFAADRTLAEACRAGMATAGNFLERVGAPPDIRHEWPIAIACWAAWHAAQLEGDFVECGVNTGILARAVCSYLDFNRLDKRFYLFDTFDGIPDEQISDEERAQGRAALSRRVYRECYAETCANFADFPRVVLVRGTVPGSLTDVAIDRVAFLSIDMNIVAPEIAAIRHFWDRLVPGAPILLDDYGKKQFSLQKAAFDAFAAGHGLRIFNLPTGQGLLLKPGGRNPG